MLQLLAAGYRTTAIAAHSDQHDATNDHAGLLWLRP